MINLHGCKQALVEYAFRLKKPGGFTVGKLVPITRAIYTGAPQHQPHCQPLAQRSASWAPCAHRTSVSPQPAQPQPNFLSTHLLHPSCQCAYKDATEDSVKSLTEQQQHPPLFSHLSSVSLLYRTGCSSINSIHSACYSM